jgi:hypothetical protein
MTDEELHGQRVNVAALREAVKQRTRAAREAGYRAAFDEFRRQSQSSGGSASAEPPDLQVAGAEDFHNGPRKRPGPLDGQWEAVIAEAERNAEEKRAKERELTEMAERANAMAPPPYFSGIIPPSATSTQTAASLTGKPDPKPPPDVPPLTSLPPRLAPFTESAQPIRFATGDESDE